MSEKDKSSYYIGESFYNLIVKHNTDGLTRREENELGRMILLLVKKISLRPNFRGYTFLEDMKSHATFLAWKGISKFDHTKTNNAFSYFTTVVMNAFIFVINKEKSTREKNSAFLEESISKLNTVGSMFPKKKFTQEIK